LDGGISKRNFPVGRDTVSSRVVRSFSRCAVVSLGGGECVVLFDFTHWRGEGERQMVGQSLSISTDNCIYLIQVNMSSSDPERGTVTPPHHRLRIARMFAFHHRRDHALPNPLTDKSSSSTSSTTIATSSELQSYATPEEVHNGGPRLIQMLPGSEGE